MKNRFALASVGIALVGLNACSDSPVAPSAAPVLTKPSFAITAPPMQPVDGQAWVCKVWDTADVGPSPSVTTVGNPVRPATLSILAANIPNLGNSCVQVATSTASTEDTNDGWAADTITVTETPAAGTSFVSSRIFYSGGDPTLSPNTASMNVRFNAFHGVVIVFENHYEPEVPDEVCDRYTWGGHRKDLNYTYGGHAGLNTAGLAWGSFEFNNHATGDKYHVWNITAYGKPASGPLAGTELGRFASGTGLKNGTTPVFMEFRFIDTGEPGKDSDQVWLAIDGNVVLDLQPVTGGNIQYHAQCKKAPKAEKH